jgi:hypothetical protein
MHCNAIGFSHQRPLWRSIILLYISMSNEGFLRPSESIINGDEQFMTYAEKEMRIALGLGSVQRNMLSKRHMSSSGTQEYGFAPSPSSLCRHLSALRSTEEPPIPLKPNASCQFLHKTLTLKKGFTPTTQHTVHMTTRSTRCCPTLTHQKKQQHPQQFEQQQQEYMIRTGEVRTIWRTGRCS